MAPTAKAKAAGVSASSFLDLKAELAKKESEFTKKLPQAEKNGKGGTVWARTNKGVAARAARDVAALAADRVTADSARAALERKAKIYEKLQKGKTGGLTEAQLDALLVDFDAKGGDDQFSSDSEDVDESLSVPKAPDDEDDPMVEYEDEFGRVRTARKSEIPRDLLPSRREEDNDDDDPFVVHNPVNHFPVFEPSAERLEAIQKAAEEADKPLESHYDASGEVRAKGAAFYTFSADEIQRQKEMEELRKAREETERTRKEMGATDVRPGESEGLAAALKESEKRANSAHTRAIEKRKREIEERRKLLEAKRRKVKGGGEVNGDGQATEAAKGGMEKVGSERVGSEQGIDSFAAFEEKTVAGRKSKSRWDQKDKTGALGTSASTLKPSTSAADEFLEQLEHDLMTKGK